MNATNAEAVRLAVDGFYTALNAMFRGDLGPMDAVWSHADDVTYLGPGGDFRVGWNEVLKSWQEQAEMRLGGAVAPVDIHVNAGATIAVVQNREVGETAHSPDKPAKVSLRATNIFRKEGDAWKMISHHADRLAYIPE